MHDKKRLEQGYYDKFHQWLDNEEEAKKNGNHKNFKGRRKIYSSRTFIKRCKRGV